ncbi:MAG: hypothetical protein HRT58_12240 [Crocinitomicaceae bacterium]|nr:hypothetical protein [Flavobacteriales bacterium]NQZ36431.1 hypothetical protein [Crocinitomicaceae bacterium]
MKKTLITFGLMLIALTARTQLIATVQMDETVEGICNHDEVFSLYSGWEGQVEPKCSLNKEEMEAILNETLQFLKDNPKFKSKGMVGVFINCEGIALKWEVSVKSKKSELDEQIIKVFETFNDWESGTLNGKAVDSHELFSYQIKKGTLTIN